MGWLQLIMPEHTETLCGLTPASAAPRSEAEQRRLQLVVSPLPVFSVSRFQQSVQLLPVKFLKPDCLPYDFVGW